jgi:hypothetical protein
VVARVVVVFVVGALDDPGDWLHPAAMPSNARAPRAAQIGLRPAAGLATTAGPGGRSPRVHGGGTTYRAR